LFTASLIERTLVVSSRLGGLDEDGMLAKEVDDSAFTMDSDQNWQPTPLFRIREAKASEAVDQEAWREIYRFVLEENKDGEPIRWLAVEQAHDEVESEEGRAISRTPQLLEDHRRRVERILAHWARHLDLPEPFVQAFALAGRLHDEGKRAQRWQRAFSAPKGGVYAKTRGPINQKLLDGYRHEFGSLPYMQRDPDFTKLASHLQELALHVVAAHHGGGRPLISTRSCEDAPPSALEARAREVALRFDRLQKRWGPWGLAWWESLLRAADGGVAREWDAAGREDRDP
jgi:CRISPR-associated endonuclease/helicase Cas3